MDNGCFGDLFVHDGIIFNVLSVPKVKNVPVEEFDKLIVKSYGNLIRYQLYKQIVEVIAVVEDEDHPAFNLDLVTNDSIKDQENLGYHEFNHMDSYDDIVEKVYQIYNKSKGLLSEI